MPVKKVTSKKASGLSIPTYSLAGRVVGVLALPKEIFGRKVNQKLLAQAVRVYTSNKKAFTASTKTRGEVEGSTAKIFRQKGTGRARHGAIRAPIFVGGGIVFGPKPRTIHLDLPKKMRKAALFSALSAKAQSKEILGLQGLEKATGKTKEIVELLQKISKKGKSLQSTLIVTEGKLNNVFRAVKNIPEVRILSKDMINAYEVLRHDLLLITKDALEKLTATKEAKNKI